MQVEDTIEDLNKIKVDWLILADRTEVVNGKLYLMGGGYDRLGLAKLPMPYSLSLAIAILVPWSQTNEPHNFELVIADQDGGELAKMEGTFEAGRQAGARRGQPVRVQLAMSAMLEFKVAGDYVISCGVNNEVSHETRFYVVDNSSALPQVGR